MSVAIFASPGTVKVMRLAVAAFKNEIFAFPGVLKDIKLAVVAFKVATFTRDDTLSVAMLAVPGTVRASRLAVAAFSDATFAREATLSVAIFPVTRLAVVAFIVATLSRDDTLSVAMLATPGTVKDKRLAVVAFRVATFSREDTFKVEMLAVPGTVRAKRLAVVAFRVATFSKEDTLSVEILAVPGTVSAKRLAVVALRVATFSREDTLRVTMFALLSMALVAFIKFIFAYELTFSVPVLSEGKITLDNTMFPKIFPAMYKFPVNVPSPVIKFPAKRLAFVCRTFDAMMTLAGGHDCPVTVKDPPPKSDPLYLGGPFAMLSHISYCFFIKIIESIPITKTTITTVLNVGFPGMATGSGRLTGLIMLGGTSLL